MNIDEILDLRRTAQQQLDGYDRQCREQREPLRDAVSKLTDRALEQLSELTPAQVMALRFESDEAAAILAARHTAELKERTREIDACEAHMRELMLESGMQSFKDEEGNTAFFQAADSVTVSDMDKVIDRILAEVPPPTMTIETWDDALQHVKRNALWGLLNNAVNKTVAKKLIEEAAEERSISNVSSDEPLLPGVKYTSHRALRWRRARS